MNLIKIVSRGHSTLIDAYLSPVISHYINEIKREGNFFRGKKKKDDFLKVNREIDLRPKGANTFLTLEYLGLKKTMESFKKKYQRLFGFYHEEKTIEVVNLRIEIEKKDDYFSTSYTRPNKHKLPTTIYSYNNIYYSDGPAKVSIISERRVFAPYGFAGGEAGKKGVNILKRSNGKISKLPHRVLVNINYSESIIIKTPGGGGFGVKSCMKSKDKLISI